MTNKKSFSEEELVKVFLNRQDIFRTVGFKKTLLPQIKIPQVKTSNGIPDLIGIKTNHNRILIKFLKSFPTLNLTNGYANVLSFLLKKHYSAIPNILEKTGLSLIHFRKVISVMEKLEIVDKNQKGEYRLNKSFNIPQIQIWSFEFKLSDWRSALRQSLRYRTFSTYVAVVMPKSKKNILEQNKRSFKRFRIGAAVLDEQKNSFEFVVKPIRCGAISKKAYIDILGRLREMV